MPDSFINRLDESSIIKDTDYTVFDIGDSNRGTYFTKKIRLDTLSKKISGDVLTGLNTRLNTLQNSINTANQQLQSKLDKGGLNYLQTEKMTGPLYLNSTLTVSGASEFYNNVDMRNYRIRNLDIPLSANDAVNKQYVDALSDVYVPLSGGQNKKMTGYLHLHSDPISAEQAANKNYVDKFLPLSGGASKPMTGYLYLVGDVTGQSDNVAANKKYVDDQITSQITNLNNTNNNVFLKKSTDSMQVGSYLTLGGLPTLSGHATNKHYVDTILSATSSVLAEKSYVNSNFVHISGNDTMTGKLILSEDPVLMSDPKQAATKNYVDIKFSNFANYIPLSGGVMTQGYITAPYDNPAIDRNLVTKIYVDTLVGNTSAGLARKSYVDSNFLPVSGGTMDGPLILKSFSEKSSSGGTSGNISLSMKNGNTFTIDMNGNITGFTFTDLPADSFTVTILIKQKGTNVTPYNVTGWNINSSAILFAGGRTPTITKVQDKVDIFCFTRVGTTWYGFIGGQNF
jgi:hypothetical protein